MNDKFRFLRIITVLVCHSLFHNAFDCKNDVKNFSVEKLLLTDWLMTTTSINERKKNQSRDEYYDRCQVELIYQRINVDYKKTMEKNYNN